MRTCHLLGTILCFSICFGGCSDPFIIDVHIDSISKPDSSKMKSYVLLPGNEDTTLNDLQFTEFAEYVKHILSYRGYVEATNSNEVDLIVFLAYGIGDPQEHSFNYNVPIWGQTGVSSSYTQGTLHTYGNFATYSGTTTYTPTYGITGYTKHTGRYVTHFRFMILDAYDLKKFKESQDLIQAWKTTVTSTGSSGDLRRVFPILVAASKDYIASNTKQKVERTLNETDKSVVEIKSVRRISKIQEEN